MNSFKKLIVILLIFASQNANANWVFFYESQMFDAKLLLTSVQQKKQVTLALIAINYKEKQYFDGVSSQVIFWEHICGETNPTIIEEKFYKGLLKEANEISLDDGASKFEKYAKKTFPNLIKQICI